MGKLSKQSWAYGNCCSGYPNCIHNPKDYISKSELAEICGGLKKPELGYSTFDVKWKEHQAYNSALDEVMRKVGEK